MCLVPDGITGESPGCANANEEVAFGFSHHKTNEDKEKSNGREHGTTHLEIVNSQAPGQGQTIEVDHKCNHQHNKRVKRLTELCDVCLKRVDRWHYEEQREHSQRDKRQQENTPEFGHVTIHLIIQVPVGCHLVRQTVPEQ